jgi:TatD DNase family protein
MSRNRAKAPETEKPAPAAAHGAWPLIDAHAHLDGYGRRGAVPLEAALEEIRRHRIFTIGNSMDLPSYERNLEIADLCPYVLPIFGIHPWNAHRYADRLDDLKPAADRSPIFGEVGLDHWAVREEAQRDWSATWRLWPPR